MFALLSEYPPYKLVHGKVQLTDIIKNLRKYRKKGSEKPGFKYLQKKEPGLS